MGCKKAPYTPISIHMHRQKYQQSCIEKAVSVSSVSVSLSVPWLPYALLPSPSRPPDLWSPLAWFSCPQLQNRAPCFPGLEPHICLHLLCPTQASQSGTDTAAKALMVSGGGGPAGSGHRRLTLHSLPPHPAPGHS